MARTIQRRGRAATESAKRFGLVPDRRRSELCWGHFIPTGVVPLMVQPNSVRTYDDEDPPLMIRGRAGASGTGEQVNAHDGLGRWMIQQGSQHEDRSRATEGHGAMAQLSDDEAAEAIDQGGWHGSSAAGPRGTGSGGGSSEVRFKGCMTVATALISRITSASTGISTPNAAPAQAPDAPRSPSR
jgi:hypothetical protein